MISLRLLNYFSIEFEAERFIDAKEIPNLAEDIYESIRGGVDAIWVPNRDEVIEYLRKSPDLPKDACLDGDVCLDGKEYLFMQHPVTLIKVVYGQKLQMKFQKSVMWFFIPLRKSLQRLRKVMMGLWSMLIGGIRSALIL